MRLYECRPEVSGKKSGKVVANNCFSVLIFKNFLIGYGIVSLPQSSFVSAATQKPYKQLYTLRTSSSTGAPIAGEIELEISVCFRRCNSY